MFLFEPLQYEFFVNGLLVSTIVGALTGLIGVYIVLRKMSYIGHGLAHSVFGGAVVSYVLNINFYLGAGVWGFLSALLINKISKKGKVGSDAAIGIVTTASFAIGVALISRVRHFTRNFEAALFGNILGVTREDVLVIIGTTLFVLFVLFFIYKRLLFTTYNREIAKAFGINVDAIDTLFSLILAATIIASIQVMGVTLIAATVVIPSSIARLLTNNFNKMIVLSTFIGALCGFIGMYISFYIDVASGATIVILEAVIFGMIALYKESNISLRVKSQKLKV